VDASLTVIELFIVLKYNIIKKRGYVMKKTTGYVLTSIFNFIAAFCFLLAAVFQKQALPKYGFYVAAICLLISATGFLYTYLKNRRGK